MARVILISILIISEFCLILAHLGCFSMWGIILGFAAVLIWLGTWPRRRLGHVRLDHIRKVPLFLLPVLALALLLFFRPYQYMDGGWDPGNYINTGVHIARTGTVIYHDSMLKETAGFIRSDGTGIKYPGLYIKDAEKGLVVPQFFHLYPVWVSIFYKLFGLKGVFYVNPFFALLSVILIFLIGERLLGKWYGLLTSVLLSLNVIQIWNARFSTSEILGQFLLLSGFYFWLRYLDKNDKSFAFWAGVSFGEFLLTGITSVLIIPILAVYFAFRHNKKDIYFIIPFFLLLAHLGIQLIAYSSIYLESVIMFFKRKEIYLAILLFICCLFILKRIKILLLIGLPVLFIYSYFIRPHISNSIEALNLVELGNWLSLTGLVVCLIGVILAIYREKIWGLSLFLIYAVFFIYDKRMFSRYPFALRRFIPVVIPGYCLCISYLFYSLKRFGKLFSVFIIPLIIAIPLYRCRDIISVRDHHNWLSFWTDFAGNMDDNVVYISNRYRWARPLSDIFGKDVIAFTGYPEFSGERICEFGRGLITEGRGVYYISDSFHPYSLIVDFIEVYNKTYKGEYLEHSLTFPPRVKNREIQFRIFKIDPTINITKSEYVIDICEENIGLLGGFDKARGFRGIEGTARWTFSEARFVIPWFGDNVRQSITIMAGGMPKEAGESRVSIYINDQPVIKKYKLEEEMREYKFNISEGAVYTNNNKRVILTIKSNTWLPSQYGIKGFPDKLGILLDWVRVISF